MEERRGTRGEGVRGMMGNNGGMTRNNGEQWGNNRDQRGTMGE